MIIENPEIRSNLICFLKITEKEGSNYTIKITQDSYFCRIIFNPVQKTLIFTDNNILSKQLQKKEYQLRKILHNKRKDTFYEGFNLKFVIRNNKYVTNFNDTNKLIILDKTQSVTRSYPTDHYKPDCPVFYTDGSHQPKLKQSAVAVILKKTNGLLSLFTQQHKESSSTLTELLAAIKAADIGREYHKYRIVTDSRYVIKGLTEWIENWKLNNWYTAQGTEVKNIQYWEIFDSLTENKFIEFEWVKAHSKQFENTLCDFYANEAATYNN